MHDIEGLQRALHRGLVAIEFVKKDGSQRSMIATLNPEITPVPKGTGKPSSNPNIMKVFDFDKMEWRSFDITRLVSWSSEFSALPESG